ncbi:MAG: peptidase M24, partial [Desulfovibrio sp.]
AAAEELFTLLRGLWPLHVVSLTGRSRDVDTWERADREFTWIAALYKAVHEKFQEVLEQGRRVQESLKEKEELANDIRARIAAVNLDKDALLAVKLDFMTELAEMREEILSQEQAVQLILAAIDDLKYDLQNSRPPEGETLADRKGELAWPVTGEVVAQWAPRQDPPVRGVGIDVEENAAVRSIYWGKVVHDGVLRGFGRVIIVLHDGDYYSLYAFLHDSEVEVGDNVAKEQTLGRAGFYPGADGPGLYFELRKGPQPVNPTEWLGQAG